MFQTIYNSKESTQLDLTPISKTSKAIPESINIDVRNPLDVSAKEKEQSFRTITDLKVFSFSPSVGSKTQSNFFRSSVEKMEHVKRHALHPSGKF